MKKIAFIINFDHRKWMGGINVIKNLINSLKLFSTEYNTVLVVKKNLSDDEKSYLKDFNLLETNFFNNRSFTFKLLNKLLVIFFGRSFVYDNFFKKNNINVVSHINVFNYNLIFGRKSIVKSFSFVTDLQHIYFKKNFSFRKKLMRNINISLCSLFSTRIILSGKTSLLDIKKVSKTAFKNSHISKFVFKNPDIEKIINFEKLKIKYNLNKNFFYLPNQYWIHKNHYTVLISLIQYKKIFSDDILVVSSGSKKDYRDPKYFDNLMKFVEDEKINQNYIYLGLIPDEDVIALMYHSIALINPSKFEGRSSTVEQAISLGKKIILSDIPIHKEQNPERAIYFEPNDSKMLSEILKKTNDSFNVLDEENFIKSAYKNNEQRLKNYINDYISMIEN